MKIICTHDVDAQEWDNQAALWEGGYFHCYAQIKYSAARSHAKPLFFRALNKQDRCVGMASCTIASSRFWPLSRHCKRVSFYTLPLTEANDPDLKRSLFETLERYLYEQGVFAIDVASYDSPHSQSILSSLGYELGNRNEFYFDLSKSLDDLFGSLRSSRRNQLRKAEKQSVETKVESTVEAMKLVNTLHACSMQRRNELVRPWNDHDRAIGSDLLASGRIRILVSYLNGEAVNADMFGIFNHKAYGLVSGSIEQGNKVWGPVHLTWTAIKIFKQEGVSILGLGGAKEDEIGLGRFKSEFGTIIVSEPYGSKNISKFGAGLNRLSSILQRGKLP